jgi:hypothetical protein
MGTRLGNYSAEDLKQLQSGLKNDIGSFKQQRASLPAISAAALPSSPFKPPKATPRVQAPKEDMLAVSNSDAIQKLKQFKAAQKLQYFLIAFAVCNLPVTVYYLLLSVNVEPPFALSMVAWVLVDLQGVANALIYGFNRNCIAQLVAKYLLHSDTSIGRNVWFDDADGPQVLIMDDSAIRRVKQNQINSPLLQNEQVNFADDGDDQRSNPAEKNRFALRLDSKDKLCQSKGSNDQIKMANPQPSWLGAEWVISCGDLTLYNKIGVGGAGTVFRGEYMGSPCAVKELHYGLSDKGWYTEAKREVECLMVLHHPSIVRFFGVAIDRQRVIHPTVPLL